MEIRKIIVDCLAGFAAMLALAPGALAGNTIYECDITEKKKDVGLISDKMFIIVEGSGRVLVADPAIMHFVRAPMVVRVARNTAGKLTLRWRLEHVGNGYQTADVTYNVVLDKKTNRYTTRAEVVDYANQYIGKGVCKIQ